MIRALGGNRLGVLRVRDGLLDSEGFLTQETLRPALLGRGDAGFADWAQAARDAGYDGPIVSETPYYSGDLHREGGDFLSLARADVSTLRRTFGESEEG